MWKRRPETFGAVACFVLAAAFALVTVHCEREANASERLVRVEADFAVASVFHDVKSVDKDGNTKTGDQVMVDAVYRVGGVTYRHRVSEDYALKVVSKLPGRGTILIDPRDPMKPPHVTPVGFVGAPLLACIFSLLVGAVFFVTALRHRRRALDGDVDDDG